MRRRKKRKEKKRKGIVYGNDKYMVGMECTYTIFQIPIWKRNEMIEGATNKTEPPE